MRQAAEFLACLRVDSEGLSLRPLGVDCYLVDVLITRDLAEGQNTPEKNALCRAVLRKEQAVLAALGFGESYALAVMAGEKAGQFTVHEKKQRSATETHRFELPSEWGDLVHLLDIGSPLPEGWELRMAFPVFRPHVAMRVRQTTIDDVKRLS